MTLVDTYMHYYLWVSESGFKGTHKRNDNNPKPRLYTYVRYCQAMYTYACVASD
jgi:hypothetical protein